MGINIYKEFTPLNNEDIEIRLIKYEDINDLYTIYSDQIAVPYFNSDNCHGDNFYYDSKEKMEKAMNFWLDSYKWGYFVRFSIIDKKKNYIFGTIEAFYRQEDGCCLLRLDLKSEYEMYSWIKSIIILIEAPFCKYFNTFNIKTKIPKFAEERKKAFIEIGYKETKQPLIGNDGTKYFDYYIKCMND